jgi:exosortase A
MMRDSPLATEAPVADRPAPVVPATWRTVLPALAFSLLWIIGWYWPTGASMAAIWARSDTFAHGFLVPPIALWLMWQSRARLAAIPPRPSWSALVLFVGAGFAWLLGQLAAVNALAQFAFVALLVLAVPVVAGLRVARAMAFPLGFLFFAVPIGEFLLPQLMEWTADFTVAALKLSGIPVYREGQQLAIPSGTWSVVEACSGVRYLIASMMVGMLYAYVTYRSLARRLVFVGVSIVVPIAANWVRAYLIVMIGHLSGNRLAVGVDHLIYGWVFFGAVMLMMFWIGNRWREHGVTPLVDRIAPVAPVAVVAMTPANRVWVATGAVALLSAVWPLAFQATERGTAAIAPQLSPLGVIGAWQPLPDRLSNWQPSFQAPSAELVQRFTKDAQHVGLYIGFYRNQNASRKLVSSENVLVGTRDSTWTRVASGMRPVKVGNQVVEAATAELRGGSGERLVVWQWYWIDGRITANDFLAKTYAAFSRLLGQGDDSAVVVVYAPKDLPGDAEAALGAFVLDAGPAIDATLAGVRVAR